MSDGKIYKIGDKTYVQKKLVLGQVGQLTKLLATVELPAGPKGLEATSMVMALGDNLSKALAIVLVEEGVPIKEKKLEDVTEMVSNSVDLKQATEIVKDFFDCNPIASLFEELSGVMVKVIEEVNKGKEKVEEISSKTPASSSPAET